jgi:hypothetical protein
VGEEGLGITLCNHMLMRRRRKKWIEKKLKSLTSHETHSSATEAHLIPALVSSKLGAK